MGFTSEKANNGERKENSKSYKPRWFHLQIEEK